MHRVSEKVVLSIIVPAYNASTFLAQAIESALRQDFKLVELIVVNDGSTDDTLIVAKSFGSQLKLLDVRHEGLAASRNRGMAVASGQFFLHLDADDLLLPGAITTLIRYFFDNEAIDIVAGQLQCFISTEIARDHAGRFASSAEPQRGHLSGVSMVRADAFRTFGYLDPSYEPAADLEWWLRAMEMGVRTFMVDDVVLHRRIHGKNTSIVHGDKLGRISLRLVREALARKRAKSG